MKSEFSVYDASSKVIFLTPELADAFGGFPDVAHQLTVTAIVPEIELTSRDGLTHKMNAPASGVCVLVGGAQSEEFQALEALWTNSGLELPRLVDPAAEESAIAVLCALIQGLERELESTARAAVSLDSQIAVLRDDLGDARTTITELGRQLSDRGQTPTESFIRLPGSGKLRLEPGSTLTQPLPLGGHLIAAIGLFVKSLSDADIHVSLISREDGKRLAEWLVDDVAESSLKSGWLILSLSEAIPRKYRYVDVHVAINGTDGVTRQIELADAAGDRRIYAHANGEELDGQMLGLRVWAGNVFPEANRNDRIAREATAQELEMRSLRAPLPSATMRGIRTLTEPKEDLRWFRVSGNDVLCHPTVSTPASFVLPIHLAHPLEGLTMQFDLAHDRAVPTELGVLLSPLDLEVDAILRLLEPTADWQGQALARVPWTELIGGTQKAIEIKPAEPAALLNAYFATRITGDKADFAHAWFREIRMLNHGRPSA